MIMILKRASIKDITELKKICVEAYSQNFHNHWNEGGLEWYLEREFNEERLKTDLEDGFTDYYFIIHNEQEVGFVKLKKNSLPGLPTEKGVEIEKIYVLPSYKGMGIGKSVLNEITKKTKQSGNRILFLCVIEMNKDAIAFYEKLGFRFHSKTSLDIPYFKEELKGMNRMYMEL
jgi:ribosomal protein S18 acetylase RimI-like enzyme|tara:strand:- start:56623 stop:57144 length:522 start_codon:yes stop_codon:yes gene_type:complete